MLKELVIKKKKVAPLYRIINYSLTLLFFVQFTTI